MKKVVLFCQAPGEMNNLLSSYEEMLSENVSIVIICLKLKSLKLFLDELNLQAEIVFFNEVPISLKKPLKWFYKNRIVKRNLSKISLSDAHIVFFSKFDLQLACYLHAFKNSESLTYKKGRDGIAISRESNKNIKLIYRLKALLLSLYTKSKIEIIKREHRLCEVIKINKYPMKIQDFRIQDFIYEKYSIKYPVKSDKSVLFFSEPFQFSFQTKEEYDHLNIELVKYLKKMKYTIFAKGHPRKGLHPEVKLIVHNLIPDYIPSEFISLKEFKFAVNFFSVALCSASFKIPAYSLIGMYNIRDFDTYNYWKQYIDETSEDRVKIISSFNQLPKLN